MKIKIEPDELTIRLNDPDFETLSAEKSIKTTVHLGNESLSFSLKLGHVKDIQAEIISSEMRVDFPLNEFQEWVKSDRIGYKVSLGNTLLFIEKDLMRRRNKLRAE